MLSPHIFTPLIELTRQSLCFFRTCVKRVMMPMMSSISRRRKKKGEEEETKGEDKNLLIAKKIVLMTRPESFMITRMTMITMTMVRMTIVKSGAKVLTNISNAPSSDMRKIGLATRRAALSGWMASKRFSVANSSSGYLPE